MDSTALYCVIYYDKRYVLYDINTLYSPTDQVLYCIDPIVTNHCSSNVLTMHKTVWQRPHRDAARRMWH